MHVRANALGIDGRLHLGLERKTFAEIVDGEDQWIIGALFSAQKFDARPGVGRPGGGLSRGCGVAVIQNRAEQWRRRCDGTATLSEGERGMLMMQQFAEQHMSSPDTLFDGLIGDTDAEGQGVDEEAEDAVRTLPALHASKEQRPEDYVIAARNACENLAPCEVAKTRGTHAERASALAQTCSQRGVNWDR